MVEKHGIKPDEVLIVGASMYSTCDKCGTFVKINKFIFGSLHICVSEEKANMNVGKRKQET